MTSPAAPQAPRASGIERRRHVRVQPHPELPAAVLLVPNTDKLTLQVFDIGVAGIGLWVQRGHVDWAPGHEVALELRLNNEETSINARVRYTRNNGTFCGLQLTEPSPLITRYVTELCERGV